MSLPARAAGRLPSLLAYGAALVFTLASGGTNLIYGWNKGTDVPSATVWAAVSLGVSIVFALSWPALIRSLDAKQWSRAFIVLLGLLLTGAYSVSAALGSAMGGRTNAAAEERAVTDTRSKAQAAYQAAEAELTGVQPARPVAELYALILAARQELEGLAPARRAGELQALIEGIKTDPRSGGCVGLRGSRRMRCPRLAEWRAEKARAEQRERLSANIAAWTEEKARSEQRHKLKSEMDKASADLAKLRPARVANSDAIALSAYLRGLGFAADPDRLNKLLVLLAVLMIECGGGISLAVGMSFPITEDRAARPTERSGPAPPVVDQHQSRSTAAAAMGVAVPVPSRLHPPASPRTDSGHGTSEARFLAMLRDRGGQAMAGQRVFAEALGVSKTQVHRLLSELADAGRISVEVGRRGTAVRLVAS